MRIFLDTNVILEYFLDREDGKTANRLFALLQEQKHSLYMTVGSFYTMIFLVDKYFEVEFVPYIPHTHFRHNISLKKRCSCVA